MGLVGFLVLVYKNRFSNFKLYTTMFHYYDMVHVWLIILIAVFQAKDVFLHRIRYMKLLEAAKVHVQITRFTCCLNMVFHLADLKLGPDCLHDVTRESIAALTFHFVDVLVLENMRVYDVKAT